MGIYLSAPKTEKASEDGENGMLHFGLSSMQGWRASGEFSGENIILGSRGDSYYEYLLKVWLQSGTSRDNNSTSYLYDMYKEAMNVVRHRLVQKFVPNGLVFVGELPSGPNGGFSPKINHLVGIY